MSKGKALPITGNNEFHPSRCTARRKNKSLEIFKLRIEENLGTAEGKIFNHSRNPSTYNDYGTFHPANVLAFQEPDASVCHAISKGIDSNCFIGTRISNVEAKCPTTFGMDR